MDMGRVPTTATAPPYVDRIKIVRENCRIRDRAPYPFNGCLAKKQPRAPYLAGIKYKLQCCAIINFSLRKNVKFIYTIYGGQRGDAATPEWGKNPL